MASKQWVFLGFGIAACAAAGFVYCGGDADEPSAVTTTTNAEAPTAAAPIAPTSLSVSTAAPKPLAAVPVREAGADLPVLTYTAAPVPQLPQPPCTSCPLVSPPAPAPMR